MNRTTALLTLLLGAACNNVRTPPAAFKVAGVTPAGRIIPVTAHFIITFTDAVDPGNVNGDNCFLVFPSRR